ncbi:DNA replication organizer [Bacillus phage BSP11]|uniref:DNA replication organizer n=1 Tax=Bacillus phage vB_BsuP-Goe1 TaxID=1807511 RepID=A0A142IG98_9CAUD|nr:GP16.7-like replication protein [Bacillus phage vB_BsuP-Goe1]AMR58253.1 DNA replication organizer [Bacillus phage vB_BsuP-Goe1]AYJ76450.1 DNA replication organizer [Bacillus phage BSP11]
METILIAGLLFIATIFYFSGRNKINKTEKLEHDREIERLQQLIRQKQQILAEINEQIDNRTIVNNIQLSHVESAVLDLYDESNIRIPVDIIEDLHHKKLSTEKEVMEYVENQRNFWKLENMKKLYKGTKL